MAGIHSLLKKYGEKQRVKKRRYVIGIIMVCMIMTGLVILGGKDRKDTTVSIRTDQEPIYQHFPSLPKAGKILWSSGTSSGIGLATTKSYFYAVYKEELEDIAPVEKQEPEETVIQPLFYPEEFQEQKKGWKRVKEADFFFQEGIEDHKKMNTSVYINEKLKAVYVEAAGD